MDNSDSSDASNINKIDRFALSIVKIAQPLELNQDLYPQFKTSGEHHYSIKISQTKIQSSIEIDFKARSENKREAFIENVRELYSKIIDISNDDVRYGLVLQIAGTPEARIEEVLFSDRHDVCSQSGIIKSDDDKRINFVKTSINKNNINNKSQRIVVKSVSMPKIDIFKQPQLAAGSGDKYYNIEIWQSSRSLTSFPIRTHESTDDVFNRIQGLLGTNSDITQNEILENITSSITKTETIGIRRGSVNDTSQNWKSEDTTVSSPRTDPNRDAAKNRYIITQPIEN
jgi:hypothetical protein